MSDDDVHDPARWGGQLNATKIAALEEQLTKIPGDIAARTKLLGYYFIKG